MNNVCKTFETTIRIEGSFGTLLSLVKPLTKEVEAVKDISFAVERGESVAYLGPNGAGKSTTIKMLTGILVPSSGEIKVNGLVPYKNRKRNSYNIGVVFGQRSQMLYDLPVQDSFDLLRYIYDIPRARYLENLKKFSEVLEIDSFIKRPVRTLSLGQRMRCEILASLLHEPDILFLDEPTIGLDVVAKERIRTFIEEINKERGITVILTTHDLADIERLCPRLIIIDKGTKVYDGSLQLIKERYAIERKISVNMASSSAANSLAIYLGSNVLLNVYVEGHVVKVSYDQRKIDTSELLRNVLAKANPNDLSMSEENIEAIIRRIYEEGVGDMGLKPKRIEVAGI
jgi:ABC-2 type transport system ATP-binding protein